MPDIFVIEYCNCLDRVADILRLQTGTGNYIMTHSKTVRRGRHFLQIPGPASLPDRVMRAMCRPLIDHRGPDFAKMTISILERLQKVFQTSGAVIVYPASGHGAWEAALVNPLSPGDQVLVCENGHFATKWCDVAERLGLNVDRISGDWRRGVDPAAVRPGCLRTGTIRSKP